MCSLPIADLGHEARRLGREGEIMFSHVTVGTTDLEQSAKFYDAVLSALGFVRRAVTPDGGPPAACWIEHGHTLPRFFVFMPFDGQPASVGNGSMVAFLAPSPEAVTTAYAAGLGAGGKDEGAPGPRPHYGNNYFGGYLRDPDGNKVLVVHRGDLPP